MALQLTPLVGTTAFPDRMGDYYPNLLKNGRIIQGHSVSGRMAEETISLVNRDLADPHWRSTFHEALKSNYRFQSGLFSMHQDKENPHAPHSPRKTLEKFSNIHRTHVSYDVTKIQVICGKRLSGEQELEFEYGFALIKTSASLVYTIHLCQQLELVAVTDSKAHYHLLTRTCERDSIQLKNRLVQREEY
jgi:hypothetical protein